MTNQKIREEFINHSELAGKSGYCNPVMAEKIADWWLSKFREMIEGKMPDERKIATFGEWEAKTYEEIMLVRAVLSDLLSKLKTYAK